MDYPAAPSAIARARPRLLMVDDQPDVLELLVLLLEADGFDVTTANDGRSALLKARHGDFDAFVLDVSMPEMDGIELAMALRTDPATGAVPIFFHTSLMESEVRERFTGYAGFVRKPVDAGRLSSILRAWIDTDAVVDQTH